MISFDFILLNYKWVGTKHRNSNEGHNKVQGVLEKLRNDWPKKIFDILE